MAFRIFGDSDDEDIITSSPTLNLGERGWGWEVFFFLRGFLFFFDENFDTIFGLSRGARGSLGEAFFFLCFFLTGVVLLLLSLGVSTPIFSKKLFNLSCISFLMSRRICIKEEKNLLVLCRSVSH